MMPQVCGPNVVYQQCPWAFMPLKIFFSLLFIVLKKKKKRKKTRKQDIIPTKWTYLETSKNCKSGQACYRKNIRHVQLTQEGLTLQGKRRPWGVVLSECPLGDSGSSRWWWFLIGWVAGSKVLWLSRCVSSCSSPQVTVLHVGVCNRCPVGSVWGLPRSVSQCYFEWGFPFTCFPGVLWEQQEICVLSLLSYNR